VGHGGYLLFMGDQERTGAPAGIGKRISEFKEASDYFTPLLRRKPNRGFV
jgi:hypothetical protein